ncbi:MAG: DUF2470 domain-containing protein [Pseudomonadota bacterium]
MPDSDAPDLLQPVDDCVRREIKTLLHVTRHAALGLISSESGAPDVTRVGLATDIDGAPIFPMSDLSGRPQMAETSSAASLLVGDPGKGDPLAHPRVTLHGNIRRTADDEHQRLRGRYLGQHPKAELYIDFKDFSLWRFEIESANFNGGFGRAYALTATDLLSPIEDLTGWGPREAGAREHMNDDHADAVELYAKGFCGSNGGKWRLSGIDPEGIDISLGEDQLRIWFDAPLESSAGMHKELVAMVGKARDALSEDETKAIG